MFTTVLILMLSTGDRVSFQQDTTFPTEAACRAALPTLDHEVEATLSRFYGKGARGKRYQFEVQCARVAEPDTI